jgi:glutaredoxin 2
MINPEEDLKQIKIDLQKLKADDARRLEHISFQEDTADAIQFFWGPHTHTDDSFSSALASGAEVINSWRGQLDKLVIESSGLSEHLYAASSTATNVGAITVTLAQYSSPIAGFEISK